MTDAVRKEIRFSESPEEVWSALTDSAVLAEWMYPNDFAPRVGHRFTLNVPPNPQAKFDGVVRCEVLTCPTRQRCHPSSTDDAPTEAREGAVLVQVEVTLARRAAKRNRRRAQLMQTNFNLALFVFRYP